MKISKFDWQRNLADLFQATVNQQSLEEAADLMVSVSAANLQYHEECLGTLDQALMASSRGENSAVACINTSGYQVATPEEALELLEDLKRIYLERYQTAKHIM